jgi:hypothetical protein
LDLVFASSDETIEVDGKSVVKAFPGIDDDLRTFLNRTRFMKRCGTSEQGEAEFAFESLLPPVQLLILGGGADAVPRAALIRVASSVYGHRLPLTHERFLMRTRSN